MFFSKTIKWHVVSSSTKLEMILDSDKEMLLELIEELEETPYVLCSISSIARDLFTKSLLENDKKKAVEYLALSHHAGTWQWLKMYSDDQHEITLPGREPFICDRLKTNIDTNISNLLIGIHVSRLFRDEKALAVYKKVPFEYFFNNGGIDFRGDWVEFKTRMHYALDSDPEKALAYGKKSLSLIDRALQGKELAENSIERRRLEAPLKVWFPILNGESEKVINDTIKDSILARKAYYNQDSEFRNIITGFLNFDILAACAYAHDKGINITVKSDYIPEWLYKGEFDRVMWPGAE